MNLLNVPSRVATAGLVALVVLDVVLVGMALRPDTTSDDPSPAGSTSASGDAAGGSVVTPSTGRSVSPSAGATAAPAIPLQTMLAAIDNQRAWRVNAGSCSTGGSTLAITTDGGESWVDAKAPLRRIVRVRPDDGQAATVVGADSSCAAELRDTDDSGGTWDAVAIVDGSWFRHPRNSRAVGTPGPSTSEPCGARDVLDLAVVSTESARVLCASGVVRTTTNTGSSWTDAGKVTGAVALAVPSASPLQTYVARLGAPRCTGVQIVRVSGGGARAATSCAKTAMPKEPGQIALSLVDGGGWLVIGETTIRSTDNLLTWNVS